jgi:adenine deaminase
MIRGNLLNPYTEEIYSAELEIENGMIKCVKEVKGDFKQFILPGFIDAHIHIESSMLTPSRFAQAVVPHGTTSVVSDPHEIANVMGLDGIRYMMEDALSVPLRFFFTVPSCVPATPYETSGAVIGPEEIDELLKNDEMVALGEMMNYSGVIRKDPVILDKIRAAKKNKKPIDGHAPLLSGEELCKYLEVGISTDHECTEAEEAAEKSRLGVKIMVREGSSAKNLADLLEIGGDFLVSDDRHPEDLLKGHIDQILKKAVSIGLDPVEAVKMVTLNPAIHYSLDIGALGPGKAADLVLVDNLENFNIKRVFINGKIVAEDKKPLFRVKPLPIENTFHITPKKPFDFEVASPNQKELVRVIKVQEGQLLTQRSEAILKVENGAIQPERAKDVLKIAVVERYGHNKVSNAFVSGFGLHYGAIASSVAHDSHNIIVVGTNSHDMSSATNHIAELGGGLIASAGEEKNTFKLPIAGLMSTANVKEVASNLKSLHETVKSMGCTLESPFMTMSFLALLVIPELKISDQGLFDVKKFQFVNLIKNRSN